MTRDRREKISLEYTPYYHVINHCVRRAFLCGFDRHTGQNLEHRRQWIVDEITQLAGIFSVDVCAFAIMSNQFHVVLYVDEGHAKDWDRALAAAFFSAICGGSLFKW